MTSPSQDRLYGANSSMAVKVPCRVATTGPITLSGEQTIDGVAVVTGDRVLVKDQASGVDNGIYYADTSSWQRAPDFDGAYDVSTGTLVKVNFGTVGQGFWYVSTTGTITPGTTSIAFDAASTVLAVVSAFMQTVLNDTTAADARTTLGAAAATDVCPVPDTVALVKGSADPTKLLRFEIDGFTAATTRVLTPPNFDGTIATLAGTEALTNKTLTSPVIDTAVTGTAIASQAQQETGTAVDVIVTPGRQQYHPSACKGWINANGSTAASNAAYNVSGTTDTGTGIIWVSWNTDFSSANHVTIGSAELGSLGGGNVTITTNVLAAAIDVVEAYNLAGAKVDPSQYCIAAFGDQ